MELQKIGAFLSLLRKEHGLTQSQLGQKLGVGNKTVSRWETGTYLPPVEMLQALSREYGVTINELLSGQRLTEPEYRAQAEENIKSAIRHSSFTLKEKISFYQSKWNREHIAEFAAAVLVTVLLLAAGVLWEVWMASLAVVWITGYLLHRNHRRMIYVEGRAFDGSGRR